MATTELLNRLIAKCSELDDKCLRKMKKELKTHLSLKHNYKCLKYF